MLGWRARSGRGERRRLAQGGGCHRRGSRALLSPGRENSGRKTGSSLMPDPVKVALVGCGFFSRNHLFSWTDLAGEGQVELVAVCDIDPAKAGAAAKEFRVPNSYTDFDEMLAQEKIEILDIVTRMDTHRALVEKAIARRIATIVQ